MGCRNLSGSEQFFIRQDRGGAIKICLGHRPQELNLFQTLNFLESIGTVHYSWEGGGGDFGPPTLPKISEGSKNKCPPSVDCQKSTPLFVGVNRQINSISDNMRILRKNIITQVLNILLEVPKKWPPCLGLAKCMRLAKKMWPPPKNVRPTPADK